MAQREVRGGVSEGLCDSMAAAKASLGRYFAFYNTERRHQSLDRRTPDSVYYESAARMAACPEEALIALSNFWGPFLIDDGAMEF